MRTFVVPDAHGHLALVEGLLRQEGLIDANGDRIDRSAVVVQLGDLCNCVASSVDDDLVCLNRAPDLFDVYLIGNHEHPYFGGGTFGGYWPDPQIRSTLNRYLQRGLIKAAYAESGVLVSHAGLTSYWLREFGAWDWSAEKIAECTNRTFERDPRAMIFEACGRERGGWYAEGGILWADWREPKPKHMKQVVGHTVGTEIRQRSGATCIDLGAGKHSSRIAGAWLRDGEIITVTHELSEKQSS